MEKTYNFNRTIAGHRAYEYGWKKSETPRLIWMVPSEKYINLWINEMVGQISDGMWENVNERYTGWLWKSGILFVEGNSCKLFSQFSEWGVRKNYSIRGFLKYDWFQERLAAQAGVETFAEAKQIWNEMNEAIKNVEIISDNSLAKVIIDVLREEKTSRTKNNSQVFMDKLNSLPGVHKSRFNWTMLYDIPGKSVAGEKEKYLEFSIDTTRIAEADNAATVKAIKFDAYKSQAFSIDEMAEAAKYILALRNLAEPRSFSGFVGDDYLPKN